MAIFDIFKKKEKGKKIKERITPASAETSSFVKTSADKSAGKEEKKEVKKESPKVKEARFGQGYKILKSPHITEKAGDLAEKNQYAFRIFPRTNKIEVKRAIEDTFGVDVVSIKIINVHGKKRRLGKIQGIRPGYKKAIVKIKKGQKIEVLST